MEKKYLSRDKIIGKQVVDSKGMIVGSVKDLSLDFETKGIALTVTTRAGKETVVEGSNVVNVGDVILLNKDMEVPETPTTTPITITPQAAYTPPPVTEVPPAPQAPPVPPAKPGLCQTCNFQNDVNSKFCIKCGSRL